MSKKRSLSESRKTDHNKNDLNESKSKKRKLQSLGEEYPDTPQDGIKLQLEEWNFDKTVFDNTNENNTNNDKKNENNKTNDGSDIGGFAGFTGIGFARTVSSDKSNTNSPIKKSNSKSPSKNKYVSSEEEEEEEQIQQSQEKQEQEKEENNNNLTNNDSQINWDFGDSNTTNSFNWSWDITDKNNNNNNNNDLNNEDSNSGWNFNIESNIEWGTELETEDKIEVIAELNGENKEKGDENDKTLFSVKVKVYAFKNSDISSDDSNKNKENNVKKWRECGEGILKVNQIILDDNKIHGRLLCRRDNIHTILLNEPIVIDRPDWYTLFKDTRVKFCIVKNKNIKEENNKNKNNTSQLISYFVKPIGGDTTAAKTLLNWINVLQNCIKNQKPYQPNNNNNNISDENNINNGITIDDDEI